MTLKEALVHLADIAVTARQSGIDVFYGYSPHVNNINVQIYFQGYDESRYPDYIETLRGPDDDRILPESQHEQIVENIKNLIHEQHARKT